MKAVVSLSLVWLLIGSAGANACKQNEKNATLLFRESPGGKETSKKHVCLSDSLCSTKGKLSIQHLKNTSFSVCCDPAKKDSYPTLNQTLNNLICFFGNVTRKMNCVGDQDQCWSHNVTGKGLVSGGCMSSNACDLLSKSEGVDLLKNVVDIQRDPKCCKTSLCNSAKSLKMTVVLSVFWLGVGVFVAS